MFRFRSRTSQRAQRAPRTALVALAAALAGAALSSPLSAMADSHAPQAAAVAVQPGTPRTDKAVTPKKSGPRRVGAAKAGPVGTTATSKAPQLVDGADPGTGGKDGDGSVANQYDLQVTYKGGEESTGVVIGAPKVYLVLWGSQWGTSSTNATGDTVVTGDPDQAAPYQQDFFKGLGSAGDGWSAVLTQYCEGIAAGSVQCPAGAAHIPYPQQGSVLAGVWVDNAAPAPQSANEPQIGAEALAAAKHFGNLTEAQNRNVQYIIDSPQGTDPDKWKELGYCAWHDFQRSPYGQLAYTNMPYLTDVAGCGTNWFGENTPRGRLDGYGIIGGHEYAETVTDPNTPGGWTDATGQEVGDKCAWIPKGSNGGLFTEDLATGSFPLQTLWSNTDHLCMASDPIVASPPVSVSTMCDRTDKAGQPLSIPAVGVSGTGAALTYSASGLPQGLAIDARSGVISGTAAATNGYQRINVTATDPAGKAASVGFWENVSAGGGSGCGSIEQITDAGFENGSADVNHTVMTDAWSPSGYNVITPSSLHAPHSGSWYAWLGQNTGTDDSITTYLNTYPGYRQASFSFWLDVESANASASDTLSLVAINQYTGQPLGTLRTWTGQNPTNGYQYQSVDLSSVIGQVGWGTTIGLKLVSHESGANPTTAFLIDDASGRES